MKSKKDDHFLDTSVLRHWLLGPRHYKAYLRSQFGADPLYLSKFVKMEFRRGYTRLVIEFCAILKDANTPNLAEALILWSERKYAARPIKAVITLLYNLMETEQLDFKSTREKKNVLLAIGRHIRNIEYQFKHKFKDANVDSAKCARAAILLQLGTVTIEKDLDEFTKAFDNTEDCRNKCSIHNFLLNKYKSKVKEYIKIADPLPKSKSKSFKKICKALERIQEKGPNACSCRQCGTIGDAIIALDAPKSMRLETLDGAFNNLCPPLKKSYYIHPSPSKVGQ